MLGSLVSVYQSQRQQQTAVENINENGGEDDSDNSSSTGFISSHDILNTLGVFLAEMGRSDRAKMTSIDALDSHRIRFLNLIMQHLCLTT